MEKYREISIDGCPEIGRGAHGIVYQTAPDMLECVSKCRKMQFRVDLPAFQGDFPQA